MTEHTYSYVIAVDAGSGGDIAAVYVDGTLQHQGSTTDLLVDWLTDESFGWGAKPHTIRTVEAVCDERNGWHHHLEHVRLADGTVSIDEQVLKTLVELAWHAMTKAHMVVLPREVHNAIVDLAREFKVGDAE